MQVAESVPEKEKEPEPEPVKPKAAEPEPVKPEATEPEAVKTSETKSSKKVLKYPQVVMKLYGIMSVVPTKEYDL